MQPVHQDVAGAEAVDGCSQLSGNLLAVNVDYQGCVFRVVKALAYAYTKECWVLPHQVASHLLLDGDRGIEHCRRECT